MAIYDDFTVDYVDRKIKYTGSWSGTIPSNRYTVNDLYSWLQDLFDEPAQMDDPVPMSAQTPTQYTLINLWFIDDESMKALYSGSIQTSDWTFSAGNQTGITQVRYSSGTEPISGDIGKVVTDGTATGKLLAYNTDRNIVWIRNTNGSQFAAGGTLTATGGTMNVTIATNDGAQQAIRSGDSVWANCFSVGTIQAETEIYIGQESEWHGGDTVPILTKLTSWWNSDTDYTASANGVGAGHIDILIKVRDAGIWIDDLNAGSAGRLSAFARQGRTVYSHYRFLGAVGNYVIPFASTGYDINQDGFLQISANTFTGNLTVGNYLYYASTGAKAIITATDNSSYIQYILLGKDLTDFTSGIVLTEYNILTGLATGWTATTTSVSSLVNGGVDNGVTITFGHNAVDVDQNGVNESYACTINCNNLPLQDVYQRVMYLTRRGSTTNTLPEPGAGYLNGEFYRGAGEYYLSVSAQSVALTEGQTVTNGSATGDLVAYYFSGSAGYMVLTNVKGTFATSDTVTDEGTGSVTVGATISSFVDVNAAPFGTFAGGRFFVARGVVLTNVPANENNNWQTSDAKGDAYQPPSTITLTLAGLIANDRGVVLEVGSLGGSNVVKTNVVVNSGVLGGSTIYLVPNVAQDIPSAGWIRVVDTSVAGKEERYEYSSALNQAVTLRSVSAGDGTVNSTSGVILINTNVGASFGSDGYAKVGHQIRNVTDSSVGVILRRINNDQIETTTLTGGGDNIWEAGDSYEINKICYTMASGDTCYFPYIDDVCPSGATSLAKNLKYDTNTPVLARVRFSDPDVGGTRILPFELLGQQITNTDLTITAIRTTDPIATQ